MFGKRQSFGGNTPGAAEAPRPQASPPPAAAVPAAPPAGGAALAPPRGDRPRNPEAKYAID
jgi:pilus assembly protein CpaF